jgi:tetratricopeptide (TPR) repeat protein
MARVGCRGIISIVVCCVVFLPKVSPQTAPPSTPPSLPATTEPVPNASQEGYVIERLSRRIDFQDDGTALMEQAVVARVQSDAGVKQLGLLVFQYLQANDTVEIPVIRVLKPDGSIVVTPAGNMQDLPADVTREAPFYSDLRQKHVAVRGLSVGDTLEYQVRIRSHTAQVPGHFWFTGDFTRDEIVREETLEISVPAARRLKTKFASAPEVTEAAGRRTYRWKTANLARRKDERASEAGEPPAPAVQLTTFESYEQVGRWYDALQSDRSEPTPAIRAKAAELTRHAATDEEKIQALYRYVALQFRYIGLAFGIGRFQPNPAEDVLANQYGDCKDKHTLLAALLKAAGIPASAALINSSRQTDPDIPSPSQFNHVITVVPQGDGYLWLDSTAEVGPFGYLLFGLRDKWALVMPEGKPPLLLKTPADPPFPAVISFRIDAKLDESGTLTGKITRTFRGDAEVVMRTLFRRVPQAQWKELTQAVSYSSGFGGDVDNVDASAPEVTETPFRLSYDYIRKEFPDWKNRRVTMPCPPLGLASLEDAEKEKRQKLVIGGPIEFVYLGKVELPSGAKPELPQEVSLKEDFGEYHATYSFQDRVLMSERRLTLKLKEIPKASFEAYRKFAEAANADEGRFVAMARPPVTAQELLAQAGGLTADELNSHAAVLLDEKRDFAVALGLLQKATEKDPQHPWAWNNLGRAYAALGNRVEAEKAYKRQIEVNPNDEYAYRNLGWMYSRQQRYEEAVEVYRKHLSIRPAETDAYFEFGWALESIEKNSEAAEVYSKLASLLPGKPEPYTSWGRALLRAGRTDEGRKQMQRALEIDDSPSTLNNVAYNMAESGVDLDENEARAQKAVEAMVKALPSSLSLDRPPGYEQKVRTLSAYLDTLGWVIFKKGDLQRSEPYLRAGLQLLGGATVAEHLAQLCARQDRYEEALRLYAQAVVQSDGTIRAEKSLEAYLTEKMGGPDQLLARARELGLKPRDEFAVRPPSGSFSWPSTFQVGKASAVVVAALTDEQGKVTEARVMEGEAALRDAALADARALQLPPVAWPGHAIPTVRTITFLYKPAGSASQERQVRAWWQVGGPPPGNVTIVSPDGEHVVSVPAAMAAQLPQQPSAVASADVQPGVIQPSYRSLMREGADLVMQRKVNEALAKYREAVKLEPDCGPCHSALAELLIDKGDRTGAIQEYRELVRLSPANAEYHYLLGLQLEARGATRANATAGKTSGSPKATRQDYQAALDEYRSACQLDPANTAYKKAYDRLQRQLKGS